MRALITIEENEQTIKVFNNDNQAVTIFLDKDHKYTGMTLENVSVDWHDEKLAKHYRGE
jgi:hypothetical protein